MLLRKKHPGAVVETPSWIRIQSVVPGLFPDGDTMTKFGSLMGTEPPPPPVLITGSTVELCPKNPPAEDVGVIDVAAYITRTARPNNTTVLKALRTRIGDSLL
jgi:hypothetical protein